MYFAQDSLPVIGLLWNPRLLPFLYLVRYLMMMVGAVEVLGLAWQRRSRPAGACAARVLGRRPRSPASSALVVLIVLGWMYQVLPGGRHEVTDARQGGVRLGPAPRHRHQHRRRSATGGRGTTSWATRAATHYAEYYDVVQTMRRSARTRRTAAAGRCGRTTSDNGKYGTTMALMLLPHWTDGCIGSMEGLFFEASGTTPYHFLTAAAMSKQSSNPVRELRYDDNDAAVGVPYLQDARRAAT